MKCFKLLKSKQKFLFDNSNRTKLTNVDFEMCWGKKR